MLSPPRHLHTSFSIISSTSSTDEACNSAETEEPGRRNFSNFPNFSKSFIANLPTDIWPRIKNGDLIFELDEASGACIVRPRERGRTFILHL
jgi:hypothetical protein